MIRTFNSLLRKLKVQPMDPGPTAICRQYSEDKHLKLCRLGPKPRNPRDPPDCYEPDRLDTRAFKLPPFIKPKIFRPLKGNEILGPEAGKSKCYKNPEYFCYHRYSIYDLKIATNAVKECIKCCE